MLVLPRRIRKDIRIWPSVVRAPRNRIKYPLKLLLKIQDPALNWKVHVIQNFNKDEHPTTVYLRILSVSNLNYQINDFLIFQNIISRLANI